MFNLSLETFVGNFSFTLLFLIMLFYWVQAIFSLIPNFNFIIFLITICGNLNLIFLLIIRWSSYKHFPLSNLYESLIFLSWSFTSIQLFFLYPEFSLNKNSLIKTHQIWDKQFTKNPLKSCSAPRLWRAVPPLTSSFAQNFPESFVRGKLKVFPNLEKKPSSAVNFFYQLLPNNSIENNISYSTIFFQDNVIKKKFNNLAKNLQKSFSQALKQFQNTKLKTKQSSLLASRDASAEQSKNRRFFNSNNSKNLNVFSVEETTLKKTNFSSSLPKHFSDKISSNKFSIIVGTILSPMALFINSFATFSLPKNMQAKQALVPALQSNWLMMHVTIMMLSYTALLFGSLLAISFLIVNWVAIKQKSIQQPGKNKDADIPNPNQINYSDSVVFLDNEKLSINNALNNFNLNKNSLISLAKILDNLSYRVLGIGFPLLTIGILSGSVWANEAWGSYWSWDPKETWAFITWLVFAIYLHGRIIKGWEGKKPAIVASVGFFVVWICYLGVNIFGTGLHSYGWIK